MGFVHIKCAQSPETSAGAGNTWIERDCLERETGKGFKKKSDRKRLVTEMPRKMQTTFTNK